MSDKMENSMIKDLVLFAIIIIVAAIVASIIFAPSDEADFTTLEVLNKGEFGENSTIYVKLADSEKNALSGQDVHVKLTDSDGKVVYDESVKTHATGVALAKLNGVSAGEYTLNITYDGNENYTASSVSQKITIQGEPVEDEIENSTLIQDTLEDAQYDDDSSSSSSSDSYQSYSQQSQSQSYSYSPQSSRSYDSGSSDTYYDENGAEMLPEYDENGAQVDPN